jgi:hypothetical protein
MRVLRFLAVAFVLIVVGLVGNWMTRRQRQMLPSDTYTCAKYAKALSQDLQDQGYEQREDDGVWVKNDGTDGLWFDGEDVTDYFARETMTNSHGLDAMRKFGCTRVTFSGDEFMQEYDIGTPQNPTISRIDSGSTNLTKSFH